MDALFEMIKSMKGSICFPINTIHNLGVDVGLTQRIDTHGVRPNTKEIMNYSLHIIDDTYHTDYKHHYYSKTFNDVDCDIKIKQMCEEILRTIKNLKLDKFTGRMTVVGDEKDCYEKNMEVYFNLANMFKDIEHVKMCCNECCVCQEWTRTQLKDCSHWVCIDCISKLEKKHCEDCRGEDDGDICEKCEGLHVVRSCPMCRGYICNGF